jgi:cytochrome c biogenesis protein CcdA
MNLNLSIGPLVSLIAGILILVVPRLLNYIVAIYLIIIGFARAFRRQLSSPMKEMRAWAIMPLPCWDRSC